MASRTKGFFEQDHTRKQQAGQWNNRGRNRAPLNEANPNVPITKPPIPANEQAKTKLKAFQFVQGEPPRDEGGDEAARAEESLQGDLAEAVVSGSKDLVEQNLAKDKTQSNVPQLAHANTYPCTPGTRLPLKDLIGDFDDFTEAAAPAPPSPEEHIGWIPNSSSTLQTPSRKRKRARSSSPSCPNTSSQRQEASTFFRTVAANGEKTTPQADPAGDLWKQYADGKASDDSSKIADFDQLIFQASPKKLETPAKSAGLRRWASTGNDWPTSKTKRRRTNGKTTIDFLQEQQGVESAGKSKVAAMVERLQESLASQKLAMPAEKPEVTVQAPSSSSPLPEVGGDTRMQDYPSASPLQGKLAPDQSRGLEGDPQVANPVAAADFDAPKPHVNPGSIHDPVGDSRVPTTLELLPCAPLQLQCKAPLPAYRRPTINRTPSSGRQYPQRAQPAPVPQPPTKVTDGDEFGDDLELSAEDLDELMSQQPPLHQRPLHQIPAHPDPPPQQNLDSQLEEQLATTNGQANQPIVIDEFDNDEDDEFGCDDLDEAALMQVEISATQAASISPRKRLSPRSRSRTASSPKNCTPRPRPAHSKKFLRYAVKQVVSSEYTNANGRRCPEKVLVAEEERTLKMIAITLRDSWTDTPVARGDIVQTTSIRPLDGAESSAHSLGQIMVSDAAESPMIIIHPDHMLTATSIADSFDCTRKAVLQQRIRASGDANKPVVYGNILHEIFQKALSANQWNEVFLSGVVNETVINHVEDLWLLGMEDNVLAIEEISAKMGEMASWARIFVAEKPSEVATIDGRQGDKARMSISKLIAIEEHIWSPQYGLQGKIDATVQMTEIEDSAGAAKKLLLPFEVKTGRTTWSAMHLVQTALYTLLLSDRYDVQVATGILYYLESSAMSRIAPPTAELRQMLQQRNRLASLLHQARSPLVDVNELAPQTQEIETSGLPRLLRNPFKCSNCYAQASCFSYHALAEGGSAKSAGMLDDGKKNYGAVWTEAVGHLLLGLADKSQAEVLKQWFIKWDRLLSFEEHDMSKLLRELWTMDSLEREAVGRCFGNLVISREVTSSASASASAVADGIEGAGGKINRFVYVFQRSVNVGSQSFAEGSQLAVGETVVVSSESGQWGLARGYVIAVAKHEITVAIDRKLGDARQRLPEFDSARKQTFKGIMTVGANEADRPTSTSTMLYRLDKDEFSNGLAVVRSNLITLMSSHPIHMKLRNLVIFSKEPSFAATTATPALPPSQLGEMNEDQRATVAEVLAAQDYALILGMPGTGKTTTIAHVIRALLAEEKTILVTSFTHTAVDNILLKIKDLVPPRSILRLGTISKINSEVQKFCQLATTPRGTINEVDRAYMGCRIVATTCMGANHAIFSRRKFDVCIVDEASQITLPISLGPLLHARKFVLVGDHYQLPPLVQNKNALEGGLDVSLFRQLSEEHPEAVAMLGKQYRMCEEIMTLANVLIYDGKLRCGNEAVAQRQLQNIDLSRLSTYHTSTSTCPSTSSPATNNNNNKCWLTTLCSPTHKVLYLNTDPLGPSAQETLFTGKNITNPLEATLAAQSVLSLLATGVPPTAIGVITLYRSQLTLIRRVFKLARIPAAVDIDSADRFQGRDKDVIVISMVRSNQGGVVGELLRDWRRVNVAFTRARCKLIVLGSRRTLVGNEVLRGFVELVGEKGWGVDLPKEAEGMHGFEFSSQVGVGGGVVGGSPSQEVVGKERTPGSQKRPQETSGQKILVSPSPRKVLRESANAANRSPSRVARGLKKIPGKVVSGTGVAARKMKLSQAAIDIFEDLTENDI